MNGNGTRADILTPSIMNFYNLNMPGRREECCKDNEVELLQPIQSEDRADDFT